jgi:hypothetical protein
MPPLLRPARPLPTGPERPASHRPVGGEVDAPRAEALARAAAATVRGPIGSTATVGPNGARMGAPGIAGTARQNARAAEYEAIRAIGRNVDARA